MRVPISFTFLLSLFGIKCVTSLVFSCEEVRYKLVNSRLSEDTTCVCVVPSYQFTNFEVLKGIFAQNDKVSSSFFDISHTSSPRPYCVQRAVAVPWRIVADFPDNIDCSQEFTLIFTSDQSYNIVQVTSAENRVSQVSETILVSPPTGIHITTVDCVSGGSVTVYTGAGTGVAQFRYPLVTWKCSEVPDVIVSFDNVITISSDKGYVYDVTLHDGYNWYSQPSGGRVVVLSSGKSDNLQNLKPDQNRARFVLPSALTLDFKNQLSFDENFDSHLEVTNSYKETPKQRSFGDGNSSLSTGGESFEVYYVTPQLPASEIWDNQDTVIVDITIGGAYSPKEDDTQPGPYCQCNVDNFFMPDGWESTDIWLDVVIILDTSAAMGAESLKSAAALIESFIGDEYDDVLITDVKAEYFTRIGLIAMADQPKIIYNLNMTKFDKVQGVVSISEGIDVIDVVGAFQAAEQMLNDGVKSVPERATARQVIYYITDSDPDADLNPLNQFKTSKGIIIVNNFIEEGDIEKDGLRKLASEGFYYSDIQENYMQTIQAFCKANCFCPGQRNTYNGLVYDPTVKAAGGCYTPVPTGVPFNKARQECTGGIIASVHDTQKNDYLTKLMKTVVSKDQFWIGYSKLDTGSWQWEDKSTSSFLNWAANEPSGAAVAKCAYNDASMDNHWGAGNCNIGFPTVCEYAPCSVGHKDCFVSK